jgi:photosystem II stability/assembly factor-like uncharacterized protein
MVLQLPSEKDAIEPPAAVEAGVIDDARARHRRERCAGAVVAALAVAAGLLFGLSGGGGGSGAGGHHGGSGAPNAASRSSSESPAVITHTPPVTQFGLASADLGWIANGSAFYVTHDGGRSWDELSRATGKLSRYHQRSIPAFRPIEAISSNITATSSPSAGVVAIGLTTRLVPMTAACQPPGQFLTEGAVVVSGDAGHTWSTHIFPGCSTPTSLSFINARAGFAVFNSVTRSSSLYRTNDGGRHWQLMSRFPAPMAISFGNRHDGLALVTANNRSGAGALYRTTDGGRTWQRSRVCGPTADPTLTLYCGEPSSFGSRGVVLAIAQNLAKARSVDAFVYTTSDAGRHWTRRRIPPPYSPEAPSFSAPNPNDLFVYSLNGVLHTTINGGRTWSSIREPGFRDLSQMQFVSADYGWVLAQGQLDYTSDGGRTWKPIGSH